VPTRNPNAAKCIGVRDLGFYNSAPDALAQFWERGERRTEKGGREGKGKDGGYLGKEESGRGRAKEKEKGGQEEGESMCAQGLRWSIYAYRHAIFCVLTDQQTDRQTVTHAADHPTHASAKCGVGN